MAIQDTDLLYVQRPSGPDAGGYKLTAGDLLSNEASDLTYEYPGTGVEQTIQDRLEQYVSVKDFGAVGDGTTDDTAAIQAAIDHAATVAISGAFAGSGFWYPFPSRHLPS